MDPTFVLKLCVNLKPCVAAGLRTIISIENLVLVPSEPVLDHGALRRPFFCGPVWLL